MLNTILVLAALGYRIYLSVISVITMRVRKKKLDLIAPNSKQQRYVFVFPVYKEQVIIEDTLRYYEQFVAQLGGIELLFVTTTKESGDQRTYDLIKAYLAKSKYSDKIILIECAELQGTKATQINYGLSYLRNRYNRLPRLVLFDCDARISLSDFSDAEQWIEQNPGAVIYSFVPKPVLYCNTPLLIQSTVLHHTERMLAFEYAASRLKSKATYPMGATMMVLPLLWEKVTSIPEPIDDIPLDYLLSFYGLHAKALPYFSLVQAPPDTHNMFRQMIPIFRGVFSYYATAKRYQISLTQWQKYKGVLLYGFYLLEPLGILLACFGNISLLILIAVQISLNLYWSDRLTIKNFLLHSLGYVIRLLQFLYFALHLLKRDRKLNQFKTERTKPTVT